VPATGPYGLRLEADDTATVFVDGVAVVTMDRRASEGKPAERSLPLAAGVHALRVEFEEAGGGAAIRFDLRPPGGAFGAVPEGWLRAPDGAPGLAVEYREPDAADPASREALRGRLRALGVRYVVVLEDSWKSPLYVLDQIAQLPRVHRADGVVVYEVPPRP
jgi:hypothetical protein